MFGPGNYTQYSVVTYIGKESEKEWNMYMPKLIHLATHSKLTQCCKSFVVMCISTISLSKHGPNCTPTHVLCVADSVY